MNRIHSDIYSVLKQIRSSCKKYEVNKMYLFGSATTRKYRKGKSDLDLLIEIDDSRVRNLIRLKSELHLITGANIDLFKVGWIKTEEMLNYLSKNKVLIYNKENAVTNMRYDAMANFHPIFPRKNSQKIHNCSF